jgi:hypothetical protein
MPALVAGIHELKAPQNKIMDGRDVIPAFVLSDSIPLPPRPLV